MNGMDRIAPDLKKDDSWNYFMERDFNHHYLVVRKVSVKNFVTISSL